MLPTIRKLIAGVTYNTETGTCWHLHETRFTEAGPNGPLHHRVAQGLYEVREQGHFFLAFWNRPSFNPATLVLELVDDVQPVLPGQASAWLERVNAPANVRVEFEQASSSGELTRENSRGITVRMPADLYEHFAALGNAAGSLNNAFVNGLEAGRSVGYAVVDMWRPPHGTLKFDDGDQALDEFGCARPFADPRKQALAQHAEQLYALFGTNRLMMFPYVLRTLNDLHLGDPANAAVFARWFAAFYRATYSGARANRDYRDPFLSHRPLPAAYRNLP